MLQIGRDVRRTTCGIIFGGKRIQLSIPDCDNPIDEKDQTTQMRVGRQGWVRRRREEDEEKKQRTINIHIFGTESRREFVVP